MTEKEKAEAYDKALERARAINNGKDVDVESGTTICEYIFPELKESEDEKIKKDLIQWVDEFPDTIWRGHYKEDIIAWLEKQGEDKKEINNFDVLPGLYKCIHRMFDGTPNGRLLFEIGNVYKCLSKHDRAEFEVSYGHSVYLEDPVVCKHFIPFESKGEQVSSQTNERAWLYLVSDVLTWNDGIGQYLDDPRVQELAKRLCSEYAQKLYRPSVLSNSSNTGKNEQKFDPKTLQPFERVLARITKDGVWHATFFSHYDKEVRWGCYPFVTTSSKSYSMCIPYNDDTKHLRGTTDEAPKFYRYWED